MRWDEEIEIEGKEGKATLTIGELLDVLTESLTREGAEVLGGELIKFAEIFPAPLLLGEGEA